MSGGGYEGLNFGFYMFGVPILVVLLCVALATGLWPIPVLAYVGWKVWQRSSEIMKEQNLGEHR